MPNLPILIASTTCQFSVPIQLNTDAPDNSEDWEYSLQNCKHEFFVNASSSQKLPVTFTTATTSSSSEEVASSSDFYIDPVFTGDGIIMFFLGVILLTIVMMYSVGYSLSSIKTKKKYLQYNGGDVEIREDN